MSITMKMKDGTVREFKEGTRAGGSWTQTLKYADNLDNFSQ